MTKDEFEKLLTDQPAEARARGAVLFNAIGATMASYNQERSVSNLRNMEAAKESFDKFVAELGGGVAGEDFNNIHAVLKYLQDNGWKASRQTIYRHQSQGKIIPDSSGKYTLRAVEKYAKTFLKQTATGKRLQESSDDLQRQKLDLEVSNLKLKNEREKFNFEKDRGLYIPREQMDIELATRAGVLIAGLKHWIASNAADWIDSVGGDTRKAGELINKMTGDLDDHINHYAGAVEFEAIFEAEPDPEKQTEPSEETP